MMPLTVIQQDAERMTRASFTKTQKMLFLKVKAGEKAGHKSTGSIEMEQYFLTMIEKQITAR